MIKQNQIPAEEEEKWEQYDSAWNILRDMQYESAQNGTNNIPVLEYLIKIRRIGRNKLTNMKDIIILIETQTETNNRIFNEIYQQAVNINLI